MKLAVGLIETKGLVGAIEAADAMVKAADVKIVNKERSSGALITIKIVGEVAAVKSAVDAGSAAAQRVGQLVAVHVIPRPHEDIDSIINATDRIVVPHSRTKSKPDTSVDRTSPADIRSEQVKTAPSPVEQKPVNPEEKQIPGDELKGAPSVVPEKQVKTPEKPPAKDEVKGAPPSAPPKPPEKPSAKDELKGAPPSVSPKPPEKPAEKREVKSAPSVIPSKPVEPKERPALKKAPKTSVEPKSKEKIEEKPDKVKKEDSDARKSQDHLKRLREEAKKELKSTGDEGKDSVDDGSTVKIPPVEELEKMNVHQLRRLARSIPSFPIKGREISIANRGTLLDFLKKL
jgi:ethanolamine utilization protein EutM